MHNKNDLKILSKSIDLVEEVYKICADFPSEEKYGLSSQIKRSSISIPSNIAEGAGRNTDKEFIHFLSIANGSSYELEIQLIVSERLHLITSEKLRSAVTSLDEIQKMNYGLQQHLGKKKPLKNFILSLIAIF